MRSKFFILLIVILFIGNISASIAVSNYSITTTYGPGETLKGWMNISLTNENADSIFEDSEGHNITLKELLASDLSININNMCSTLNCIPDYSASNPSSEKSFVLGTKQSKLIGFKFTKDMTGITSVSFVVDSSADSWCANQLMMDFENDGTIEKGNTKFNSLISCESLKQVGCYNSSSPTEQGKIGNKPYCQRITLTASPGFKVSAWVRNETSGNENITLQIHSLSGTPEGNCELNKSQITTTGNYVTCNINHFVSTPQDHYVCINGQGGTGDYFIRGHSLTKGCGFHSNSIRESSEENYAYDLFTEGLRFSEVGTLFLNNSLEGYPQTLNSIVQKYIVDDVYGSLSCSKTCVFPINIISGKENQNLVFKNLKIFYNTPGFDKSNLTEFYDLTSSPAVVNSNFKKISLDGAKFTIPSKFTGIDYWIKYNGTKIIFANISVQEIPVIGALKTNPSSVPSAFPTEFEIFVKSAANITNYVWSFGDNSTEVDTKGVKKITHTYPSKNKYQLKITAIDALKRSATKVFDVDVVDPREVINTTLEELEKNLGNLKSQIEGFDDFTEKKINEIVKTDELNDELQKYITEYKRASSNEELNNIVTSLLTFKIPESIFMIKSAESITFTPNEDNVNVDILQKIAPKSYDAKKKNEYVDAIIGWQVNNMDVEVTLSKYSSQNRDENTPLLQIFEVSTKAKNKLEDSTYLVLRKLDGIEFDENSYKENEIEGYYYIELKESENKIVFSTTEEIEYDDLPLFVSPKISELELLTLPPETPPEPDNTKWIFFAVIIFSLLIVAGIIYVFLQMWYKRKYEGHLFKNRNNLYNLLVYIQNERKKGMKDDVIASKLRKIGWNSEQVAYAMKKHAGKRTGMAEIPVDKLLGLFKKKPQPPKNEFNRPGQFERRF